LIRTRRLVGDRIRFPHYHAWASLFLNPDVTAHDGRVWTADRIAAGFYRQLYRWETKGLGYSAFFDRDGVFVGISGLREHPSGVELGYAVCPEHRGKGMATEMARGVLATAGPGPVFARTRTIHAASRRILEKIGFEYEGEGWIDGAPNALYRTTARIAASRRSSEPGATHV
jgi:RimJ/RimL family protein N-acetyltransferase